MRVWKSLFNSFMALLVASTRPAPSSLYLCHFVYRLLHHIYVCGSRNTTTATSTNWKKKLKEKTPQCALTAHAYTSKVHSFFRGFGQAHFIASHSFTFHTNIFEALLFFSHFIYSLLFSFWTKNGWTKQRTQMQTLKYVLIKCNIIFTVSTRNKKTLKKEHCCWKSDRIRRERD